jgi:hypothetical protein
MPTDLVLLVADKNIEHGLRGLLSRPQALGIRSVTSKTYVHPQRDPGCAQNRTNSSVSSQPTMIVRSSYLTITDAVARIAFQPS